MVMWRVTTRIFTVLEYESIVFNGGKVSGKRQIHITIFGVDSVGIMSLNDAATGNSGKCNVSEQNVRRSKRSPNFAAELIMR